MAAPIPRVLYEMTNALYEIQITGSACGVVWFHTQMPCSQCTCTYMYALYSDYVSNVHICTMLS